MFFHDIQIFLRLHFQILKERISSGPAKGDELIELKFMCNSLVNHLARLVHAIDLAAIHAFHDHTLSQHFYKLLLTLPLYISLGPKFEENHRILQIRRF